MKVLVCIDALGVGGKERQAVELLKGLASNPEIDCLVVCLESDDFYLHELNRIGVSVEFIPRRTRWDVGMFRRIYDVIRQYRPDVIHTNGLMSSFHTLPFAKLMHIPVINGSIRNAFTGGGFRWTLERWLLKVSDYRVANSYAGLRSRGFSEEESRNSVIYNGFDFSRVARLQDGSAGLAGNRESKTVGMVAEFSRLKDYSTFIQAARRIASRRKDVSFVMVGDGETLKSSQQLAEGLDSVRFLGKRKDVEQIVETFDVGALCTFGEGLSNSVMEYMALKKPVVATDSGGTRELVVDGETGFLVPPSAPDVVADRIEYLLDNPDAARRMGEAGETRLKRRFSITRMVEETISVYRRAVANSRGIVAPDTFRRGRADS